MYQMRWSDKLGNGFSKVFDTIEGTRSEGMKLMNRLGGKYEIWGC